MAPGPRRSLSDQPIPLNFDELEHTPGARKRLARRLLYPSGMTTSAHHAPDVLNSWLKAVSNHLEYRRVESQARPRPKRNRERERARREARQLFAEYYAELAVSMAS